LVTAGVLEPVSTFTGGPEALFRLTEHADDLRDDFILCLFFFSRSAMARTTHRSSSPINEAVSAARISAS
jgi:hypothetical protein